MCVAHQTLGEDPFRRSPVVALLPCVRLDNNHNLKLFQATLCEVSLKCLRCLVHCGTTHAFSFDGWALHRRTIVDNVQVFMGGKYLPTPAWLVFFAVVDELSAAGSGRPEVWSFLRDQCLTCIKSTRDFSDIGDRVPLLEAMVGTGVG